MANFLNRATAWLAKTVRQAAPTRIRYSRGEYSVVIADAVKGGSDFASQEAEDVQIDVRSIDWLIDPASLVLNGSATRPRESDVIETLDDADQVIDTFGVSHDPGIPPWEWDSQYEKLFRIHTTRLGPTNV